MADPGTVIGIVSLVGELLQGLKSLHRFFADIKDAPSDFQALAQELSITEAVLVKTLDQFNIMNRDILLETAIRNCGAHVTKLESLIRPLQVKGQDGKFRRNWKQIATAFKKEDFQKHIAMLHSARLNIIAAQGAWAIDLHHSYASKTYELNQSMETHHSNAVANTTEISNKLEYISEKLANVNDAVHINRAITIAGIEEFPAFMKPMVQAAVDSAIEKHLRNLESPPNQESNAIHSTMSVKESERLEDKQKSIKRSIQSHSFSRMTKTYHFWFGKAQIETVKKDLSFRSSNRGQNLSICESLWQARILVLPALGILRKGTLVTLEYITRENRKTSFQINIEPIRIISRNSPVFNACREGNFTAVRLLIEGGQASRHDRDNNGLTLLDATIQGVGSGPRDLDKLRNIEILIDYLISTGINPSELTVFDFTYHSISSSRRTVFPSDSSEIGYHLRYLKTLICAPTPDLPADYSIPTHWMVSLSVLEERFNQVMLQLVSQDNCTVDLGEILSDPRIYIMMSIFYDFRMGQSTADYWLSSIDVKIKKFLSKNSSLLEVFFFTESDKLRQYCFLEKAIMSGSFFVHYQYVCGDPKELRDNFKKFLIKSLTLLLECGHCPRGTLGRRKDFPDLDWMKVYSPTKIARDLGVLELWREALVRSGHDASDIIDESFYLGLVDLFDGLSYQYSEVDEDKGEEDNDDTSHKPSLVGKAARMALTVVSSIV